MNISKKKKINNDRETKTKNISFFNVLNNLWLLLLLLLLVCIILFYNFYAYLCLNSFVCEFIENKFKICVVIVVALDVSQMVVFFFCCVNSSGGFKQIK